jgi:hypothetical protein
VIVTFRFSPRREGGQDQFLSSETVIWCSERIICKSTANDLFTFISGDISMRNGWRGFVTEDGISVGRRTLKVSEPGRRKLSEDTPFA